MVERFRPPGGCGPRETVVVRDNLRGNPRAIPHNRTRTAMWVRLTLPAREASGLLLAGLH
jgi:hypothetical protein